MKGAIVFVSTFLIFLAATLASPQLPPGKQLYSLLGVQEISEPVLGVPATTLVSVVLNGVVYGIIVWLAYSVIQKTRKPL
jgi:hypothetical protein